MPDIAVEAVVLTGLEPTFTAATAAGDTFENNGQTYFHIKNGGGGAINATFDSIKNCDQGVDHNVVVNVPAGEDRLVGPFSVARFGSSVAVSYDSDTSVTVRAIRMSRA